MYEVVDLVDPKKMNFLARERVEDGKVVEVNFQSTKFDHCENQIASSAYQLFQPPA